MFHPNYCANRPDGQLTLYIDASEFPQRPLKKMPLEAAINVAAQNYRGKFSAPTRKNELAKNRLCEIQRAYINQGRKLPKLEDLEEDISADSEEIRQAYREMKTAEQELLSTWCPSVAVKYTALGTPRVKMGSSAVRAFEGFQITHDASMTRTDSFQVSVSDLQTIDDILEMGFEEDR